MKISFQALFATLFLSLTSCDQFNPPTEKEISQNAPPAQNSAQPSNQEELFPRKENLKNLSPETKKPPMKQAEKRKPSITELPFGNSIILPVDHVITDSSGRKLNAIITARYAKEIAVIRKKDSKAFNLPISKLSQADIDFVTKLPVSKKPEKVDPYIVKSEKQVSILRQSRRL